MGTIVSLRKELIKLRISRIDFAHRCGMGTSDFDKALSAGGETTVAMDEALLSLRGETYVESSSDRFRKPVVGETPDPDSGRRLCVVSRLVRNPTLLLVQFSDGAEGRIRKRKDFAPRLGQELEVEVGEEPGYWTLVGRYRPNGVRVG